MKKVLLTSSSTTFLERNMNLLMDKGFQLFTAVSGLETLKLQQKHFFDLIISDLELEDMDGCRLCSELSQAVPSRLVPVVLICYDTFECVEKVKKSNARAMILRPVDPSQLLVTIGSFIDMQLARSKRVAFNAEVSVKMENLEFSCVSRDISTTGILLETGQKLFLEKRISCQFNLLDFCQIQTEGEVARCISLPEGKNLYGIKFIKLSLSKKSAIEKYVFSNNQMEIKQKSLHLLQKRLNLQDPLPAMRNFDNFN